MGSICPTVGQAFSGRRGTPIRVSRVNGASTVTFSTGAFHTAILVDRTNGDGVMPSTWPRPLPISLRIGFAISRVNRPRLTGQSRPILRSSDRSTAVIPSTERHVRGSGMGLAARCFSGDDSPRQDEEANNGLERQATLLGSVKEEYLMDQG